MAPPKDIARSYPKRGLTADVGFRSEPKFCGDGSIELNGSSQYLNAELSSALGDSFTIMGWAKREGPLSSYNYIVNTGASSGAGNAVSISITNTNPGILYFFDNSTSVNTSNTVEFNEWFHFALTVAPGAGNVKLYKNGIDGTPSHSVAIDLSDVTFEVGRRLGGIFYFRGKIFDLRVYDETLTQDQIRELLNNPGQTVPTGLTSADLIHRYLLETDANDSGATGNNLTANNSPTFGVDRAQLPRGLDLARGAAMARVYTGRALDQDGSVDRLQGTNFTDATATACTVSFWMYQRDGGPGRIIHNFGGGATAVDRFIAFMSSSSFYIAGEITSGNRLGFTLSSLPLNQWHHVVFVLDGNGTTSLNTTILYLNGEKYDSPGAVGVIWDTTTFDIGGTSHGYQNQLIAGVKVFNTKLTDAQARELYHNPEQVLPTGVSASNLRRYYPLSDYNDTGGTGGRYFQDMGADGEPLEDIGSCSMAFAQPVPCPQLGLQQSATRVYFENNTTRADATLGAAPGTACTMSAWVMVEDTTSYQYIFTSGTTFAANAFFGILKWNTDNRLYTVQSNAPMAESSLVLSDYGEWNHVVVMTKSTAPYVRFFINGVEDTSITDSGMVAFNLTSTNVSIGSSPAFARNMQGFANDCAIWDVELSDPEVASLYNSGVQGMDVSTVQPSNLKGWWKCDDLTSFKDYSGNGANATLTGSVVAASFPENASGSTIVGDFSMKRKGVSVLNHTGADDATAIIPAQEAVYPKAGSANGYTIGFCYRKIKDGIAMVWGNTGASTNDQFMCFQQAGPNLRFNLGDGSSRPAVNTSNITDSDWHHYTLTISYATTPAEVKIYVDGAVDHSSTQSITGPPALHPMHLGTGLFDGQGPVGCFKFYQVALSADEVKRLAFSDLRLIKGLNNE